MDAPLGLLKDFRDQGYALTCCAYPRADIVCELQVRVVSVLFSQEVSLTRFFMPYLVS